MALNEKAMAANLTISAWSGRKKDREVTKEVERNHDAEEAGNFNKILISKKYLSPIENVISRARIFHRDNTMPWGDNGDRLLPTTNHQTYVVRMNTLKNEFDKELKSFLLNYDEAIIDAERRLKTMFNEKEYPSHSEIGMKFRIKTSFFAIPDTDFRVDLSADELKQLKDDMEEEINTRLGNAVKDIWKRINEQLVRMSGQLNKADGKIYTSLFESLVELVDLIPRLNITNDPNIAAVCTEMQNLVVHPDSIRTSDTLRKEKAKEVDKLLTNYKDFFKSI